jgi:hypothetical protein
MEELYIEDPKLVHAAILATENPVAEPKQLSYHSTCIYRLAT